jgi:hypothetical protein
MKDQIANAIEICKALASAIYAAKEIPSGHLYAAVMGHMSLETYNACLSTLEKTGLIKRESSHLVRWTGGEIA